MVSSEIFPYHSTGGLGIAVSRLLRQLANSDVHVALLTPCGINIPSSILNGLIKFYELSVPICETEQDSDDRTDWLNRFSQEVIAYVKSFHKYSLIVLHDNETAECVDLLKEGNIKCSILYWMHSLYDYPYKSGKSLLGTAVQKADWVAVSSGVLEDAVQLEWPQRLKQIKYALLEKKSQGRLLLPTAQGCVDFTASEQGALKIKQVQNTTHVLFSGRVSFLKGLGFLQKLANTLAIEGIRIRITGQKPKNFDEFENIDWLGWLDKKNLFREYKRAICLISPSLTEGFGLSVAEALYIGCTVISFPVGGLRDLKGYINLNFVQLTIGERELLYLLWYEMLDSLPNAHIIWKKNQHKLQTIQDKFSELVLSTIAEYKYRNKNFSNLRYTANNNGSWGDEIHRLLSIVGDK